MPLKLILDRSAFAPASFGLLSSHLKTLVSNGAVRVYMTPMLLSETMGLWLKEGNTLEVREHLQFILDIAEVACFEDHFIIFKSELGIWPLRKDYYFMKRKHAEILRRGVRNHLAGLQPKDMEYVRRGVQENRGKARNLRKAGLLMRAEVSKKFKALGGKQKDVQETWPTFRDVNLEGFGNSLIERSLKYRGCVKYVALKRWAWHRERCPYFTAWVTGILYAQYYAMRYPNARVDQNAQADIEHLLNLWYADGIISEEQRFMKKAWEDLYRESGKQYLAVTDLKAI